VLCVMEPEVAVTTTCEVPVGVEGCIGPLPQPAIAPTAPSTMPHKIQERSGLRCGHRRVKAAMVSKRAVATMLSLAIRLAARDRRLRMGWVERAAIGMGPHSTYPGRDRRRTFRTGEEVRSS
jgi:hypothetical protein